MLMIETGPRSSTLTTLMRMALCWSKTRHFSAAGEPAGSSRAAQKYDKDVALQDFTI